MNIKQTFSDFWELTKPGVTFMVIISTFGGFYLGMKQSINFLLLFHTLLGTWLVAAGTNALNQLIEYKIDATMKRTKNRPVPAGRLSPQQVKMFAIVISVAGIAYLIISVNILTGILAAITLTSYVFVYTPLKRKTHISTLVGAVPGALPAMGGWTAIRNEISIEAWTLFAILFFWQLPHFLAIACIYKDDYARGGFKVLPVVDESGSSTGLYIIANCLALLTVSILPTVLGLTGTIYFTGVLVIGLLFLFYGIKTAINNTNRYAKQLLHASIIYLPVLYALMFADKISM